MGVIKKKPYEISVWEDRLVTENDISYYKEIKLAVIGSDKMESPNRAFDPVLTENVNGEKTLTFSLAYKYYDEFEDKLIANPFYSYLINERKIKLFYNNEWNEFVIKECEESSEENIFKYTAKELFSLELAKLGYDVTLSTELNNNQGTIIELAKKVLEHTDWEVDEDNSDLLTQFVQEPLYQATITSEDGIEVLDLDTNKSVTLTKDEIVYIFYNFISDKVTDNVQFIREADRSKFFIDDDNVIKSTNYRFISPIEYTLNEAGEVDTIKNIAKIDSLYLDNQGYRLVYKIQTTYDPIMDRTVDIYQMPYEDSIQEIYHFLDYNYTTSDVVLSYITNGANFELFEDGKIQGWYNTTSTSSSSDAPRLQPIRTTTYPELAATADLQMIDALSEINGYIELKFNDTLTSQFENTYFNEGFEHSASMIDHISAGEKFVLRTRYYTASTKHGDLVAGDPTAENGGLRVIVAKYETIEQECYLTQEAQNKSKVKIYKILPSDIVLQFDEPFVESFNIINSGTFNEDYTQYIVDKVIQTPSNAYVYMQEGDNNQYIWNNKIHRYILKDLELIDEGVFNEEYTEYSINDVVQNPSINCVYKENGKDGEYIWNANANPPAYILKNSFADYYLTTATAKYSFTNEQMTDPKLKLGVFLYTKDNTLVDNYVYLQDIQLTRYYEDGSGKAVTLGNVPTAINREIDKFYLKPTTQVSEKEINTYGTLDALAKELGVNAETISPVFNEDSEKILSIEASNSNYFNILQDLCEKFECWLDIRVSHDEDGSITLDEDFNPIKKVAFKEYAGKDNFAGFRHGINLQGITRNIDSNEIVTKLIVDPVQSEYSDTGSIDIQRAKANASGQSYILNFSYYLNRGLITQTREEFNKDLYSYNSKFKQLNKEIIDWTDKYTQLSKSLTKLSSERNTYTALIEEAERDYNKAIADFLEITNWEYETFITKFQNLEGWAIAEPDKAKDYLKNDTVLDIVAQIYVSTVTLNNYSGILTNLDKEYQDADLECNGAREYGISVSYIPGNGSDINPSTQVAVDDYISGLQFQLKDINGATVLYSTGPNDRVFNVSNAAPYKSINFISLPNNYNLECYQNGETYVLDEDQLGRSFNIYDNTTDKNYNIRFTLVPKEKYLEKHKGIQQEIDELIEQKNQLEKEFYKKYSRFLLEGTWSSQDYIDPELYYFDALQVSDTSAQPKVSYTINVLEVSQIDGLENYDFRVGDKTYIEDPDFFGYLYQSTNVNESIEKDESAPNRAPVNDETIYNENDLPIVMTARSPVREEVIVSEIEWHFDEPDNNTITVQNYKTRFEDLFQRISATVQTVQRNEITYPKTSSILDQSGLINGPLLADSLNGIGGIGFALTTNGSVQATQDGLLIRDLLNPANVMRLASSGLQVSTDGGSNWGTAISAEGISADVLTAGTINTQRIWVMDGDNPSFRWDKAGLNAYGFDEHGNDSYDLKTYVRFDKYGLYGIKNDENYVATDIDDAIKKAYFSITWKGFSIKNSYTNGRVEITSDDDFRVLTTDENGDDHTRIKIGAVEKDNTGAPTKYGINIMNDDGEVVFDTGDDGNVTMTGTINAQAGMFSGTVSVGNSDNTHIIIDGSINNPTISSSNYSDGAGTGWIINSEGDATFSNVSVRGAIKTAVFEYEEIQAVGGAFLFRPSSTIKTARYIPLNEPTEEIDEDGETYTVDYYKYVDGNKVYNDLLVTVEKPLMFTKNNWVKLSNYNELGENPAADVATYGLVHIYEISDIDSTATTIEIFEPITEEDLITRIFAVVENPSGNPFEQQLFEKNDIDEYVYTQDIEVVEGKTYYEIEEVDTESPVELQLYERIDDEYILTLDSEPEEGKIYYNKTQTTSTPTNEIVLAGGCAILDSVPLENIAGGALIDFGSHRQEGGIDVPGEHNYGIGINSSDNYVNLPARAISLFETTIHPNATTKVTYNYRGILGTLPTLPTDEVYDSIYNDRMAGTQGIYTDNMYIGDANQFISFYEDANGDKQLRIRANQIVFEAVDPDTHQPTGEWHDVNDIETEGVPGPPGPAGEDAISTIIDSSAGNVFINGVISTILRCYVYKGGIDITNDNNYIKTYTWTKININDGSIIDDWTPTSVPLEPNAIQISTSDVTHKAVFQCSVDVEEV